MQNDMSDDNIPLLDDLITPGDPEKITDRNDSVQTSEANNKQSDFELIIEQTVDIVLQKYMDAIREDLTRRIVAEVRDRLSRPR